MSIDNPRNEIAVRFEPPFGSLDILHSGKTQSLHGLPAKMDKMEDITVDQIEAVHRRVVEVAKGDCRILSEANLNQLVFRANLIPECVPRAAFIFYSLCAYPAFREGNSGTALAVIEQVLLSGGYRITGKNAGIMALAEGILAFTAEPEEIEQWLYHNVRDCVSQ